MHYLVSAMLIVVAVIHLLPSPGALGIKRLTALYGLSFGEPNLAILMRHRAVLFGLLGLFFLFAAFQPEYQIVSFIAGFVSLGSFLWLAWSIGGYNAKIARVFIVDVVALVSLFIGAAALAYIKMS
jgi:hypothetical protein